MNRVWPSLCLAALSLMIFLVGFLAGQIAATRSADIDPDQGIEDFCCCDTGAEDDLLPDGGRRDFQKHSSRRKAE
jgi:hypothetical protein